MKLLYLANGYPPVSTAGTENYTAGIASAFAQAGNEVRVVCAGDWDKGNSLIGGIVTTVHDGVTVTRLNMNWTMGTDPNRFLYDNPYTASFLESVLGDFQPDLVHITSCYTLSASIIRPIKALGYPLIITLTDFWFLCPRVSLLKSNGLVCDGQTTDVTCLKCMIRDSSIYGRVFSQIPEGVASFVLKQISRHNIVSRQRGFRGLALNMAERKLKLMKLLNEADVLIAPSRSLVDIFAKNGVAKPIRIEGYGHRLDWVETVKRKKPSRKIVFGYVGRITGAKGVHVFIEAMSKLTENDLVLAHVWGNMMQEPEYAEWIKSKAPAQIVFRGKFGRDEIADVFSQIDVLVTPSIWYENNPLVIQEAFAAGIPVIASNLGGMSEFVKHDVNGLLFETGDSDALARMILRFVEEPDIWERLRTGIAPVKTIQQEMDSLSSIYHDAARKAPFGPKSLFPEQAITHL